jgi:hypothetical protein
MCTAMFKIVYPNTLSTTYFILFGFHKLFLKQHLETNFYDIIYLLWGKSKVAPVHAL